MPRILLSSSSEGFPTFTTFPSISIAGLPIIPSLIRSVISELYSTVALSFPSLTNLFIFSYRFLHVAHPLPKTLTLIESILLIYNF